MNMISVLCCLLMGTMGMWMEGSEERKKQADQPFPMRITVKKALEDAVESDKTPPWGNDFIESNASDVFLDFTFGELLQNNFANGMPTIIARVEYESEHDGKPVNRYSYYDAQELNKYIYGDRRFWNHERQKTDDPRANAPLTKNPIRYYVAYGKPDAVDNFAYIGSDVSSVKRRLPYEAFLQPIFLDLIDYVEKTKKWSNDSDEKTKKLNAAEVLYWLGDVLNNKPIDNPRDALALYEGALNILKEYPGSSILKRIYLKNGIQDELVTIAELTFYVDSLRASLQPAAPKKPTPPQEEKKKKDEAQQAMQRGASERTKKIVGLWEAAAVLLGSDNNVVLDLKEWPKRDQQDFNDIQEQALLNYPEFGDFLQAFVADYFANPGYEKPHYLKFYRQPVRDMLWWLFDAAPLTEEQQKTIATKVPWIGKHTSELLVKISKARSAPSPRAAQPQVPVQQPKAVPAQPAPGGQQVQLPAAGARPQLKPAQPKVEAAKPQETEFQRKLRERREGERKIEQPKQAGAGVGAGAVRGVTPPAIVTWQAGDAKNKAVWQTIIALLRKNKTITQDKWTEADWNLLWAQRDAAQGIMKAFIEPFYNMYARAYDPEVFVTALDKIAPALFGSLPLSAAQKQDIKKVVSEQFMDQGTRKQVEEIIAARVQ